MKNLFLVVVMIFVVSAMAFAQASTTASVTANVTATLTITAQQNLSLGSVSQGGTVTVLSNAAAAARFYIYGAGSASTTVTVTPPTELTSGSNTLPFTAQVPRSNTTSTQGSAILMAGTTGGTATTSATGDLYVWVGGAVTAGASQATGAYSGTITVGVTQP